MTDRSKHLRRTGKPQRRVTNRGPKPPTFDELADFSASTLRENQRLHAALMRFTAMLTAILNRDYAAQDRKVVLSEADGQAVKKWALASQVEGDDIHVWLMPIDEAKARLQTDKSVVSL